MCIRDSNCADITVAQITADLATGATLAMVQDKRKCGTFCGSCLPELKQMIASQALGTVSETIV